MMRNLSIILFFLFSLSAEAATYPTLKSVVTEGTHQFTFQLNNDVLRILRNDGKSLQVRVSPSRRFFDSKIHFVLEDGLLEIREAARTIDLRMFDAQVSFIGNTDQVVMLAPEQEAYFPDLVAIEREKIVAGEVAEIPNRPEFVSRITGSLSVRRNPLLMGEASSGIMQDLQAMAKLIAEGKIPSIPRTARIRQLSLDTLWGATPNVSTSQDVFRKLLDLVIAEKSVLLIDEFYRTRLMGASLVGDFYGGQMEGNDNFFEAMRPDLDSGRLRVISISPPGAWSDTFKSDKTIQGRFDQLYLPDPTQEEFVKRVSYQLGVEQLKVPVDQLILHAMFRTQQFIVRGSGLEGTLRLLKQAMTISAGAELSAAAIDQAVVEVYHINPAVVHSSNLIQNAKKLKAQLQTAIIGQDGLVDALESMWMKIATGAGNSDLASGIFAHGSGGNNGAVPAISLSAKLMGFHSEVIDMSQFPGADVSYFHDAIYQRLSRFPFTVFILKNIERAHPYVQYAALPMIQAKPVLVSLTDDRGLPFLEELNTSRALFVVTSSVEPGPALGFRYSAAASVDASLPAEERLRAQLSAKGVVKRVLDSFSTVVSVVPPSLENYKIVIEREIQMLLLSEGQKQGVKLSLFQLSGYIEMLTQQFKEGQSSFSEVRRIVSQSLEPLLLNAIIQNQGAQEITIMPPHGCDQVLQGINPWIK